MRAGCWIFLPVHFLLCILKYAHQQKATLFRCFTTFKCFDTSTKLMWAENKADFMSNLSSIGSNWTVDNEVLKAEHNCCFRTGKFGKFIIVIFSLSYNFSCCYLHSHIQAKITTSKARSVWLLKYFSVIVLFQVLQLAIKMVHMWSSQVFGLSLACKEFITDYSAADYLLSGALLNMSALYFQ